MLGCTRRRDPPVRSSHAPPPPPAQLQPTAQLRGPGGLSASQQHSQDGAGVRVLDPKP